MKQNPPPILIVKNFMRPQSVNGLQSDHGEEVHRKLISEIEKITDSDLVYLSMKDIQVVDASFSREAIIRTIKKFRGVKGFCVIDIDNEDYLDNFVAGIIKLDQPVFFKLKHECKVVSPAYPQDLSKGVKEVFDFVKKHKQVTAATLKDGMNISITNASTRLKNLLEAGYLLRRQETAPSGGIEYLYYPIG